MRYLYSMWRISLGVLGLLLVSLLLGAGGAPGGPAGATGAPDGMTGTGAPGGGLTATPTPTATHASQLCTAITGAITNSDPTQIGGLNPNGPTSVCQFWPGCPGVVDNQPRHYDVYRFVNLTSLYNCITIRLDAPSCTGANAVISAAYYPPFDPAHICTLYQAGTALSPSGSYSFYIPCCARGAFDLVVAEANPGAGCGSYTVTVLSDVTCPTGPTPTWTPAPTSTPTHTPTPSPTCVTSVLDWRVVSAPSPGQGVTALNGVDALASNDVWAVGYSTENSHDVTLIEHWNGQEWSVIPSPNSGTEGSLLAAVAALAPNDVWAVGSYQQGGLPITLTEHWDGSTWSIVANPNTAPPSLLHAVTAVAPNDVWAVGVANDRNLALHWDGIAWTIVPTPNVGPDSNVLLGVTALAANDVWAVGRYNNTALFWLQTLVLHWDGTAWSIVPSPNTQYGANLLDSVAAVAANDIWAVGMGNGLPLTEHWNGSAWSIVPSPPNGNNQHDLYSVAAASSSDVWAVGRVRDISSYFRPLLEHWNGSAWGAAPGPPTGPGHQYLYGITALTGTDIWAVGQGNGTALTTHYTVWPCGTVTPLPSFTPSPTRTGTPTPGPSGTPTGTPPPGGATGTPTSTPCALVFNDVPPGSTFYATIHCLACRGIVGGYPCGGPGEPCPGAYYRPNNNVTRGQVSKIVSESAAFSDPVPSTQQTFEDMPPSGTFWLWVERLAGRGIIGGYPCGGPFEPCIGPGNRPYFRPNNNVTRGQLAKITSGAAGWTETPTGQTFADVPPGSTFYADIERVAGRGIVNGYPCGGPFEPCIAPANRPYFRPNNPATRGQMSKIAALAFFPACAPAP
jgi:hypothetical protein